MITIKSLLHFLDFWQVFSIPLALKIISTSMLELFDGQSSDFFEQAILASERLLVVSVVVGIVSPSERLCQRARMGVNGRATSRYHPRHGKDLRCQS